MIQRDRLSASLQTAFDAIIAAGRSIEPALERARSNSAIEERYQGWLSRHGLQATKESLATVARQAIYFQVLNQILTAPPASVFSEDVELSHFLDVIGLDTSSHGVLTSACISLIERGDPADNSVRLIEAGAAATADDLVAAIAGIDSPVARVIEVPQVQLGAKEKWTGYLHTHKRSVSTGLPETELGQLLTVKRGIATGHNRFFCLTEKDVKRWGLPSECLRPVVTGARDLPTCVLNADDFVVLREAGRPVWLFYWPVDWALEDAPESVRRYLAHGEELEVPQRYICKNRHPWYVGERRAPADVLFTLFNRENPRFVLNEARVLIVNVLHGLSVTLGLSRESQRLKALLAWLNSDAGREGLRQAGGVYGGMLKAEPGELSRMRVPDVRRLDLKAVCELAMLFDNLCITQRQQSDIDTARRAIDDA